MGRKIRCIIIDSFSSQKKNFLEVEDERKWYGENQKILLITQTETERENK